MSQPFNEGREDNRKSKRETRSKSIPERGKRKRERLTKFQPLTLTKNRSKRSKIEER